MCLLNRLQFSLYLIQEPGKTGLLGQVKPVVEQNPDVWYSLVLVDPRPAPIMGPKARAHALDPRELKNTSDRLFHLLINQHIYRLAVTGLLKKLESVSSVFSEMCSPRKAGKRTLLDVEIPKCFDLIDCPLVLPIPTCKVDVKNISDARAPEPENRV